MLLTLFYMVATWIQAWRLSTLRARLSVVLKGPDNFRPSIMFYGKSTRPKEDPVGSKSAISNGNECVDNMLSSHFCSNRNDAKLGDLLWFQADKRLCTIYPQQKIDILTWLVFPHGKTLFPLCSHNYGQASIKDPRMHVLIEADMDNYSPLAYTRATKLEDYGQILAWTSNKYFGVILETDLDHITKFSTTLMNGECFINNGLLLTRVQSVLVSGKPCIYNGEEFIPSYNKKLIGKAQWDAHIKTLRIFGSAARLVAQQGLPMEVEDTPGIVISPGTKSLSLQMPMILEITLPGDISDSKDVPSDCPVPSTPPPTPASASAVINGTASRLSQALTKSMDLIPMVSADKSAVLPTSPSLSKSENLILKEDLGLDVQSSEDIKDSGLSKSLDMFADKNSATRSMPSQRKIFPSTSAANYSPSKKVTDFTTAIKPMNILIYGDSSVAVDNVKNVLDSIVNRMKYIVYILSASEACSDIWVKQAILVIVCGNVGNEVASQLVEYMVKGGKLLALCSDTLHTLLPSFKTAEVREHELVRFSYGKWKHVRMMHHIFCYQASPAKTRFSQDHEDVKVSVPQTPATANVYDKAGNSHIFHVRVLGTEETWHTPSLLLADLPETGGKAVFSQIHLEADPSQYEFEESKFNVLKQSNSARLEIFSDLLSTHLGVDVSPQPCVAPVYTPGFFLGTYELKLEMLKQLKDAMQPNNILKMTNMDIQFCEQGTKAMPPSSTLLPVMIHSCPDNFSTVEYFEILSTKVVGRLVIYSDVMTSSMNVTNGRSLYHGLAIIPRRQTQGQGRHVSLLQHMVSVAVVLAVKSTQGYEKIDIRLKWPNDIYAGSSIKLGGLLVQSNVIASTMICNIGVGINLSNKEPTCSINQLIARHNELNGDKLQTFSLERFLALIFNQLENLLNSVQGGNMDTLYETYYQHWLHTDADVTVMSEDGTSQEVKVIGIDDFGYLQVQGENGNIFSVHPNGNSFDMCKGLIIPRK
ncbi:biotin--protein ligase isoform X2 [Orussus abietinus]|uniref:biotin--protein ligase isoform X2 n=1 Tax=Orussus abietinus TaxID=222816 RepID=UPI000626CC83|nr:biotin--protein ligase isoform X2 [Orussus abietinus]